MHVRLCHGCYKVVTRLLQPSFFYMGSGGETFIAASSPLAVNMPPTKVCLQCKTAVLVRWKTCERCDHVFRSKRKAECNLREKAMIV